MNERLKDIMKLLIRKTRIRHIKWSKIDDEDEDKSVFFIYLKDGLTYISCGCDHGFYRFDIIYDGDTTKLLFDRSSDSYIYIIKPLIKELYSLANASYEKTDVLLDNIFKEIEESEFIGEKEEEKP
jgi:WD40 repeat protein